MKSFTIIKRNLSSNRKVPAFQGIFRDWTDELKETFKVEEVIP